VAINPTKATLTIGDTTLTGPVKPGSTEIVFNLPLKAGKTTMSALFESADGKKWGAYYAYVEKLNTKP